MTREIINSGSSTRQADILDHAGEFADLVARAAPQEYARLLEAPRYQALLQRQTVFNHGKLFAYAEFVVFRREFKSRFPEASRASCINAFAGLFLKNDISISNLVEFVEGADDREQLMLNTP